MYKGLRTLQAASLPFWVIGAGTLSGGFVALSKRVTAVHYLKHIQGLQFTFVLRISRQKKHIKKVEPAGSTDPRPPLPFKLQLDFPQLESRGSEGKGEGDQ